MSSISCRFYVSSIEFPAGTNGQGKVVLTPAYANGANTEWATATPSGRIELQVSNPGAVKVLNEWRLGRSDIHITMQPVEEVEGG
jgi:hypothetical protein